MSPAGGCCPTRDCAESGDNERSSPADSLRGSDRGTQHRDGGNGRRDGVEYLLEQRVGIMLTLLALTLLAPDIVEAIMDSRCHATLNVAT
jgi:hypothetical protein